MPATSGKSIAVVGAGIIGTVIACELSRHGEQVTLYERDRPGAGASFGNSGVLSPAAVVPVSMPGLAARIPRMLCDPEGPLFLDWRHAPRLVPWLVRFFLAGRESRVREISEALAALNGSTLELLLPLLREAGLADAIERKGFLYISRSEDLAGDEKLEVSLRMNAVGNVRILDRNGIHDIEPEIADDFRSGVLVPDAAHCLDPANLVEGLAMHFSRYGGCLVHDEILDIREEGGCWKLVGSGNTVYRHETVVIAAGMNARQLTDRLGYALPLESQRGYHATMHNPGISLNAILMPVEFAASIVPMSMGIRIGGTVELSSADAPERPERAAILRDHAKRVLPSLDIQSCSIWSGSRPCLPDSLPVICPAPRHRGVFLAFGHGHQGVTGAAGTARLIVDMIKGRRPFIDPAPFAATRFRGLKHLQ